MEFSTTARSFRGERLRDLRKSRQLSQTQLGSRIGAHVTSISDWERGDNAPSPRHVAGLAQEFGVGMDHFYADDDEEEALAVGNPLSILEALSSALEIAKDAMRASHRSAA